MGFFHVISCVLPGISAILHESISDDYYNDIDYSDQYVNQTVQTPEETAAMLKDQYGCDAVRKYIGIAKTKLRVGEGLAIVGAVGVVTGTDATGGKVGKVGTALVGRIVDGASYAGTAADTYLKWDDTPSNTPYAKFRSWQSAGTTAATALTFGICVAGATVFTGGVAAPVCAAAPVICLALNGANAAMTLKEQFYDEPHELEHITRQYVKMCHEGQQDPNARFYAKGAARQCATYSKETGCKWTETWNCPNQKSSLFTKIKNLGSQSAGDDGTQGYDCCCNKAFWRNCATYKNKDAGCKWTDQHSCPNQPKDGTKGRADDDGSEGYDCCCKQDGWMYAHA